MSQPTYKFKWTNVDLKSYMEERRFIARRKREQANILIMQAEIIDDEMSELGASLIAADAEPEG